MIRALDRVTAPLNRNSELLLRATLGFFFVSVWAMGGIMLTPETKTTSPLVAALQLAIAAGLLWRRTLPQSGLGMIFLFGLTVSRYGVFHIADYPIFVGIAIWLVIIGLQRNPPGLVPVDVLRIAAGVTLMWASVEKWAYPEWSFPLFIEHPGLAMGFDAEFYMRAAGMVEFVLAFALLWTPLVRRIAAVILQGMFISACFEFGKIDIIGHAAIIAVLFVIMADDRRRADDPVRATALARPWFAPVGLTAALAVTLAAYYVGHAVAFDTAIL